MDLRWHKLALSVQHGAASLHVDCSSIETKPLEPRGVVQTDGHTLLGVRASDAGPVQVWQSISHFYSCVCLSFYLVLQNMSISRHLKKHLKNHLLLLLLSIVRVFSKLSRFHQEYLMELVANPIWEKFYSQWKLSYCYVKQLNLKLFCLTSQPDVRFLYLNESPSQIL